MGSLANSLEGSSGTGVSNSNSAGPNQFNAVTVTGTGTTCTYDNTHAHTGSTAAKILLASAVSSTAFLDWSALPTTPTANCFVRAYFYLTSLPPVNTVLAKFLDGASVESSIQLQTTGILRTLTTAGGTISSLTESFPLNQWVRVEFEVTGISGVNGTVACRIFSGANLETTNPDSGGSVSASSAALTGTVTDLRVGTSSAVSETGGWTYWIDDVAYSDVATPGPLTVNPMVLSAVRAPPPPPPAPPPQIIGTTPALAAGTASLTGLGTLSAAVTVGTTASLSGLGSLSAAPVLAATASLSGLGSLSATPALAGTAALSGAGTLTAAPTAPASAALSGSGTLTAAPAFAATAVLSGAGTLSATPQQLAAPPGAVITGIPRPRPPPAPQPRIIPAVQPQDFLVVVADMQPAQHTTAPPTVVAAQISGLSPQPYCVLIAGDCTNDGDNTGFTGEFANFDSMYGGIKTVLRPSPGNHDWGNVVGQGNLTAYDTYWGSQAHSGATPPHFYSFDTPAGWHVVALDSDEQWVGSVGNPSSTYTALANDLAANTGKPIIAFWHHPRFSDGTNTTDPGGTGDTTTVQDIWNLLRDYACDLVFSGHCHSYQRFPKFGKTGSADSLGIREFVVGTGGSGLFTLTGAPGSPARSDVNSWQSGAYDQLNSQWFGHLQLFLTPTTYSWKFVSQNAGGSQNPGAVLDSGGPVPTNLSQGASQPVAFAELSGLGTLSAAPTAPANASLSGLGSLSAAPAFAGSAALSGLGSLSAAPAVAGTGALSGAGTLAAPWKLAATGTLTGLGTLSAAVTVGTTASLSGLGSLSAAGVVPPPFTVGVLTASDAPGGAPGTAGVLTASTVPSSTITAASQRTGGPG